MGRRSRKKRRGRNDRSSSGNARPSPQRPPRPVLLLVGTKTGLFLYRSDAERQKWRRQRHIGSGAVYDLVVADPRNRRTVMAAVQPGSGRPTILVSNDRGRTWASPVRPPVLARPPAGTRGRYLDRITALVPGSRDAPGTWYAGTAYQGLFRTTNRGETWRRVTGLESLDLGPATLSRARRNESISTVVDILVDPLDSKHLVVAVRPGGVIESEDGGKTWLELNAGVRPDAFLLQNLEYSGDPQRLLACPANPRRLYLQSRSGLYSLDLPGEEWSHIGASLPKNVGDIGRAIVSHPRDPDTAWCFPLDGSNPMGPPAPRKQPQVYRTDDKGAHWRRRTAGLPKEAWWQIRPAALVTDDEEPVGVYFGTTSGQLWSSGADGKRWTPIADSLPPIRSLAAVSLPATRAQAGARRKTAA